MSAENTDVWAIQDVLSWTREHFARKGIESPRLDAELLLAHILGCDRIRLYTHFDQPLSPEERAHYRDLLKRRAQREPIAYILGEREFFGRPFVVTPAVLIPRPETEHLVEAALAWLTERDLPAPRILDLGTGSGALAITLAKEWPQARVTATDIDEAALSVARANAKRHGKVDLELLPGDLFEPVGDRIFDVIVSNPPYVESTMRAELQPEVRDFEPHGALFAGAEGLDVIARLASQAREHLAPGGLFLCEHGHTQHPRVVELLGNGWTSVDAVIDLQGHKRAVQALR